MRLFLAASLLTVSVFAQTPVTYRVVTSSGTQTLTAQSTNSTVDLVTLDAVARLFGLTVRDDARAGGAVVVSGSDRIIITAGQANVSVNGRVLALSAPVTRSGNTWLVPIDMLRAIGRGLEVRRGSRLIVVPPAVVPSVTSRLERTAAGARLTVSIDPAVPARVTREGNQMLVRVQAQALDLAAWTESSDDWVRDVRAADTSIVIELGSNVTNVREDMSTTGMVVLELIGATPPATTPAPAPVLDRADGGLRTVVLDPGHGGEDAGARSADGLLEKDVALSVAQRVKSLLESRFGLRVLLTRDDDRTVDLDRRAALANNNKADLFIGLHANASPVRSIRGTQVLSLDAAVYADADGAPDRAAVPPVSLPVVGGGTRSIDVVPWHLAQLPQADVSAEFAGIVAQRLAGAGIVMHPRPIGQGPWRGLVGANMPAVLVELGVLSNNEDARLLGEASHLAALAEAIAAAVGDVRTGLRRAGGGMD